MSTSPDDEVSAIFLRPETGSLASPGVDRLTAAIGAIAFGFGLAFTLVALEFQDVRLGLFTVVVFGVALVVMRARGLLKQARDKDAILFVARSLLVVAVTGALLYPAWVVTMCLMPILAMSMASAYADREQLPLLGVASVISEAVVILAFFAAPMTSPLPEWLTISLACAHFTAAVVMTLYSQFATARLLNDRVVEAQAAHLRNERFIVNMSHEIRTPLTAVHGFAEVLEATDLGPQQRRYVENILVATRHLSAVCTDLLELQRTQERGMSLELVDLRDVVEQAVLMCQPLLDDHPLTVDVSPALVRAHAGGLKQVLINLLQNAARHTPSATPVRVSGGRSGAFVEVRVADDGPGIPQAELVHLFTGFGSRGARSAAGRGAGVALAVSGVLVERMGGAVICTSELGRGAAFRIRFPAGDEA